MLSQNPGCNRFHSSFDVFVCERSAFSDAADVLDRLANATIKKRSEDATPLLVNFLAKLVLAFVRSSEDNSGDDDVSIDEYSAYKKPRAREWMNGNSIDYSTQNALSLSLSPDVENFRDINDRNERNKAFKGSLFLSLRVYISASLMKRRCMKRSERMIFRVSLGCFHVFFAFYKYARKRQKKSHLWTRKQRWRKNATKAVAKRDVIVVCK